MNVGIIGAGNVGRAVASAAAKAGHGVSIASRDSEDAEKAAAATGARSVRGNEDAAKGADILVLAVPYAQLDQIVAGLGDALTGHVVVDATNPVKPDFSGLATEGTSAAEQAQKRAPKAKLVKAFNTAFAPNQADPTLHGVPLDGFIAGDDVGAKNTVMELLRSIGFRPIDAGPLSMARHLESLAFLNMTLNAKHGWPWQSGWKLVGPSGEDGPDV